MPKGKREFSRSDISKSCRKAEIYLECPKSDPEYYSWGGCNEGDACDQDPMFLIAHLLGRIEELEYKIHRMEARNLSCR